jgi:hypothetical protein
LTTRRDAFGQFAGIAIKQPVGNWRTKQLRRRRPPRSGEVKFPLTINVQDAKENICKMKLQLEVAKPELIQKKVDQS